MNINLVVELESRESSSRKVVYSFLVAETIEKPFSVFIFIFFSVLLSYTYWVSTGKNPFGNPKVLTRRGPHGSQKAWGTIRPTLG